MFIRTLIDDPTDANTGANRGAYVDTYSEANPGANVATYSDANTDATDVPTNAGT